MAFDEGINDEIDNLGDSVTVRIPSRDNFNKWGDVNNSGSASDTTTVAIANILGNDDLEVQEGRFQNGDKRFFFKTDESNLDNDNLVRHDGKWYRIEDSKKHQLNGEIGGFEIVARKV